jgi:hypothetical protein
MALARVVTFEGVDGDRVAELKARIDSDPRPEEIPATEIVMLHDKAAAAAVVVMFFDTDADYEKGDAALGAMDPGETPGRRTSVGKYDVAIRKTA